MEELTDQLKRVRAAGGAFVLPPAIILRLSGSDAFRYLNGQVTRDLGRLAEGEALASCLLTPKGKLCATLLVRRDGGDLLVEADASTGEAVIARLERYIVADDVTITVETRERTVHCFGEAAANLPGITVNRLGEPGKDLQNLEEHGEAAEPMLLDPAVVEILRIERGIPRWGSELGEEILPPEAGLDRTHIDYDRGCYPGQEVISRLKSIGRVNRLLHRFQAPGAMLRPGMAIVARDDDRELGILTSAAAVPGEGSVALGYLPRGAAGSLCVLDPLTGGRTPLSIMAILGP